MGGPCEDGILDFRLTYWAGGSYAIDETTPPR